MTKSKQSVAELTNAKMLNTEKTSNKKPAKSAQNNGALADSTAPVKKKLTPKLKQAAAKEKMNNNDTSDYSSEAKIKNPVTVKKTPVKQTKKESSTSGSETELEQIAKVQHASARKKITSAIPKQRKPTIAKKEISSRSDSNSSTGSSTGSSADSVKHHVPVKTKQNTIQPAPVVKPKSKNPAPRPVVQSSDYDSESSTSGSGNGSTHSDATLSASSDDSSVTPIKNKNTTAKKPIKVDSETDDYSSAEEIAIKSEDSKSDENFVSTHDHRIDADKITLANKRSRGRPRKTSLADSSASSNDAKKKTKSKGAKNTTSTKIVAIKKAEEKVIGFAEENRYKNRKERLEAADPKIAAVIMKTENLFELVTTQCNAIRIMIDSIREFTFGFYLVCDENGIRFEDTSTTNKLAINGYLHGNEFSHYECTTNGAPLKIGISTSTFYANIKSLTSNKNIMGIYINKKNPLCMNIVIMNKSRSQLLYNSIPLGDFPENPNSGVINLNEYKCIFTYPSAFFREIFRNMNNGQFDYIEFTVYANELTLSCISDSSKRSVNTTICAIMHNDQTVAKESPLQFADSVNKSKVYRGIFCMKKIVQFTRGTQNCTNVKIFLENDLPLAIQYDVSNHGTITLYLEPIKLQ